MLSKKFYSSKKSIIMKTKMGYLLMLLTAFTFILSSCKKDEEEVIVDPREAVIGSYNITEAWSWAGSTFTADGSLSYNMTITKSSQSTVKILVENLRNDNLTFEANLNGNDFNIPSQAQLIDNVTVTFTGSGKFTSTSSTFNFTAINYPMYTNDNIQIKGTLTSAATGKKL